MTSDIQIPPDPKAADEMSLFDHLRELRKRIFLVMIGVIAGACACYSYSGEIFDFLSRPYFAAFPENLLIGTGPAEAFMLKIKVAIFAGMLLSSPWTFMQLWLFVRPGLHDHERKLFAPFMIVSTSLFTAGVAFCYFVVLPFCFEFFAAEYRSIGITATIRISEHLSMMAQALLGFGAVFELPVLAFLLGRAGIITHDMLISGSRYAIVGIFIVSAVMTPPDVLTQLLMAAPLLALYGISILVVRYTGRKTLEESDG